MLRSGRLVILLCSSMNNISLASLPRQIVWIVFYNKWYLFMHFIFCDKWWIKCSSFSLTGTWHNYTEPIYINFLLTYWMIISHVFLFDFDDAATKWNLLWTISSSQNWKIWNVTSENELVWGWKYQIFSVLLPFPRKEYIAKGAKNSRIGNFSCIEFFDSFNNLCLISDKSN